MKDKKIVLWVLVILVILGSSYFVFKNYKILNLAQKNANLKQQPALIVWFGQLSNCGGWATFDDEKGHTQTRWVQGDYKIDARGKGYCLFNLGGWGDWDVYSTPSGKPISLGDNNSDSVGTMDPNANNDIVPYYELNHLNGDIAQKNFLDWITDNNGTCYKSFTEVEPLTKDQSTIQRFVYDMFSIDDGKFAPDIKFPWTGASEKCQTVGENPVIN